MVMVRSTTLGIESVNARRRTANKQAFRAAFDLTDAQLEELLDCIDGRHGHSSLFVHDWCVGLPENDPANRRRMLRQWFDDSMPPDWRRYLLAHLRAEVVTLEWTSKDCLVVSVRHA